MVRWDLIPPAPVADSGRPNFDTLCAQVGVDFSEGRPEAQNITMGDHTVLVITSCDIGKREMGLGSITVWTYADAMTVGNRIKHWRGVRNRTQVWLAQKLGVNQNTISGWERGRTEPSRECVIHK